MFIYETSSHLLAFQHSAPDTGKTYQHLFQGYLVSAPNEYYLVTHKKHLKAIERKNLGSTMGVLILLQRPKQTNLNLDLYGIWKAGTLFSGFDEFNGDTYFYLPHFSQKEVLSVTSLFQTLGFPFTVTTHPKGVYFTSSASFPCGPSFNFSDLRTIESKLSFFFGLTLLYGKFEIKDQEFRSIKIHLPLSGAALQYKELFHQLIGELQTQQYFLQESTTLFPGGEQYQITSNDGELIDLFAFRSKQTAHSPKSQRYQDVQTQLLDGEYDFSLENTEEIATLIQRNGIKILVK